MDNKPGLLSDYPHHQPLTTRWMDNDIYGHVNNVTYLSYFDTVANQFLIEKGGLDIAKSPAIGLVVESHCRYFASIAYPERITGALRVEHLGNSSVRYGIGIFKEGREEACAEGYFVHVFVDRASNKPHDIPAPIRQALEGIKTG
ncbi:acyl-CoA thioesterase [Aestuariispira insulae]|nr:thioesterase family protein [Aestuariispira insulae]